MKIFVVNLKSSVERRKIMEKQLDDLGLPFEILEAVNGKTLGEEEIMKHYDGNYYSRKPDYFTPGMAGCTISHYNLYKKIVEEDIEVALILEDDMQLSKDLPDVLKKLEGEIREDEIIMLFYQSYEAINLSSASAQSATGCYNLMQVINLNRLRSTGAYIVSKKTAKKMAESLLPFCSFPDDWKSFYDRKIINGVRVVYPFLLSNTYEPTTISPNKKGGAFLQNLIMLVEEFKIPPLYQLLKMRRKRNILKSQQCFILNESPVDYRK